MDYLHSVFDRYDSDKQVFDVNMIVLRRATQQDRGSILHLQREAISEICKSHYHSDELQSWSGLLKPGRYEKAIHKGAFFVAEENGSIVAFGHLDQDSGSIEGLYVKPDYLGLGLGTQILQALERVAEMAGRKIVHLSATLNAISFYQKRGYRSRRHWKRLLPSGQVTCLLMSKELGSC